MQTLEIQVEQDHIESLTKFRNPIIAIEELIWNGLDADATKLMVCFEHTELGGLKAITVSDNGLGIHLDECERAFGHLGGSPKCTMKFTPGGRVPHGKLGKGRFRAFGLGGTVRWRSRYKADGVINQFEITASRQSLKRFLVGDAVHSSEHDTGVTVTIVDIAANYPSLSDAEKASSELAKRLALYTKKYPGIEITYDGLPVDPSKLERHSSTYPVLIAAEDSEPVLGEVTVIEWSTPTDRALYFCDENGFALEERAPGIQAPGYNFTAYFKSSLIPPLVEGGAFAFEEMHPSVRAIMDSAKDTLKSHFRSREAARSADLVNQWQKEDIYPYDPAERDPLKQVEREVFDVCAAKVQEYLPSFEKAESKSKRLTFRLIREALENNPDSLQAILRQVLELPQDQQDDLAAILGRTHLSAIINAAKTVVDRLDFIGSLDSLLFGEFRATLLERRHLHRILVEELWLFGEQYTLGIDDESLRNLLRKHISILEREDIDAEDIGSVSDLGGKDRIIDLMLYRQIPQMQRDQFEHLVIELKRPSCRLGQKEIGQIENYAFSVSDDERFDKSCTKWTFILIGNELDPFALRRSKVQGRQFGHIHASDDGAVNIYVKRWSTILAEAKWRYQFFKEKLELEVTSADGLHYLRQRHRDRLPEAD